MGYRTFVSMNIAIIGNCRTTGMIAEKLASAGHKVFIGLRDDVPDDIKIPEGVENVFFDSIHDAAAMADVIVLSSPALEIREIAYMLGDVRKKIIVDVSGNIFPKPDYYVYTVRATRSITGAEHVVKAFNCVGFHDMMSPGFAKEENDMFLAGNSIKAKAVARILSTDMGFANIYDFGDQDTIPLLEDMARCWHNLAINQKMGEKIAFKIVKR